MLNVAKPKPHLFFPNFCFAHPSGEIKKNAMLGTLGYLLKKHTFTQPILLHFFQYSIFLRYPSRLTKRAKRRRRDI